MGNFLSPHSNNSRNSNSDNNKQQQQQQQQVRRSITPLEMEIEDQLLSCLAGNAFSSTCATIAILALLVLLGACALEQDEDDDDDDDLGKNADGDWIYARYNIFTFY